MNNKSPSYIISSQALKRIQVITGLIFGAYLSVHFVALFSAHWGPSGFGETLECLRSFYQNPKVEPILIGSAILHQLVGFLAAFRRTTPIRSLPLAQQLHYYAGYYLALVFPVHFTYVRLRSLVLGPDYVSEFAIVTRALELSPFVFYPYYGLMILSGIYHLAYGACKAIQHFGPLHPQAVAKVTKSPAWWSILAILFAVGISSVVAFTQGLWYTVGEPALQKFAQNDAWVRSLVLQ